MFPLCLAALSCMLPKMVLSLYIYVYSIIKVVISQGGQLSQFIFLLSIHCRPFQQILLLGPGNVSYIP